MFSEASDWMSTRSGRVETKKLEEFEEWSCGGRIFGAEEGAVHGDIEQSEQ